MWYLDTCTSCERKRCVDCCPILVCEGRGCSEMNCMDCCMDRRGNVKRCEICKKEYCPDCRLEEYNNSPNKEEFCEMCKPKQYYFISGHAFTIHPLVFILTSSIQCCINCILSRLDLTKSIASSSLVVNPPTDNTATIPPVV